MKKILLFVFALQTLFLTAQTPSFVWVNKLGGVNNDIGNAISADATGNVYTTGTFSGTADFDPSPATYTLLSAGSTDIFISKLNASGAFVWSVQLGSSGIDVGTAIKTDASGNVFISGYFTGTVDFNPNVGTYTLTSSGSTDIFVVKLDASGNFIWAKNMGGSGADECKSITTDVGGNVYTTGYFNGVADFDPSALTNNLSANGSLDVFISKLDASGNFVWAKALGGGTPDIGNSITTDASGNVYTTGNFSGLADFDPSVASYTLTSFGQGDIFISKLDASGNLVWAKQMGGTTNDVGNAIAIDASGNVCSAGYFFGSVDFDPGATTFSLTSNGVGDIFVSKLDGLGNFIWAKNMGGPKDDFAHGMSLDASGNIYTTGYFADLADFDPSSLSTYTLASFFTGTTTATRDQAFVSKLDGSGNFVWAGALGGTKGYGISATTNDVYTTGYFTSNIDFDPSAATSTLATNGGDDIFVHKMNQLTTNIKENSDVFNTVYPNPTSESITVISKDIIDSIIIFDISGQQILKTEPISKTVTLNLTELVQGIYFAKIISGNRIENRKVLKL